MGRAAAAQLGRPFLDFDREIERREGATVYQLFARHGEAYFRARERELTEELARTGGMVLAPGGGWIMDPGTVALLRPPARMIYLRVAPEIALRRLGRNRDSRPLLRGPDPLQLLRGLLAQREPRYATADFVVNSEVFDIEQLTRLVVRLASGHERD